MFLDVLSKEGTRLRFIDGVLGLAEKDYQPKKKQQFFIYTLIYINILLLTFLTININPS